MTDDRKIILKDSRVLSFAEYGDPGGLPVIGIHGMPGSRIEMKAFEKTALGAGVRVVAPERPGYGLSTPNPGGSLANYPLDVQELAGALRLDRFAVLAVSGGGPYGLACASRLAQRLTAVVVVSGIGPLRLPGSTRSMARPNRFMFNLGRFSPGLVGFLLPRLLRSSLPSMNRQVQAGTSPVSSISPELFAIVAGDQAESIRNGGKGIAFDMKNLWQPWGFKLEDIKIKVTLRHGVSDDLAPAGLAQAVAGKLPNCDAYFYPGEGHVEAWLNHDQEIIQAIVSAA